MPTINPADPPVAARACAAPAPATKARAVDVQTVASFAVDAAAFDRKHAILSDAARLALGAIGGPPKNDGDYTIDGGTLAVLNNGALAVYGTTLLDGQVTISTENGPGNFACQRAADFSSTVAIGGNATCAGTLAVTGAVTCNSTVSVLGSSLTCVNLGVANDALIGGDLGVSQDVTVGGSLAVTGATTLAGTTQIGASSLPGAPTTELRAYVADAYVRGGALHVLSHDFGDGTPRGGDLEVSGLSSLYKLEVSDAASFASTLKVGTPDMSGAGAGDLRASGNVRVGGTFTSTGAATCSSTLSVTGATTLAAASCTTLTASGLVTCNGGLLVPDGQKVVVAGDIEIDKPAKWPPVATLPDALSGILDLSGSDSFAFSLPSTTRVYQLPESTPPSRRRKRFRFPKAAAQSITIKREGVSDTFVSNSPGNWGAFEIEWDPTAGRWQLYGESGTINIGPDVE